MRSATAKTTVEGIGGQSGEGGGSSGLRNASSAEPARLVRGPRSAGCRSAHGLGEAPWKGVAQGAVPIQEVVVITQQAVTQASIVADGHADRVRGNFACHGGWHFAERAWS